MCASITLDSPLSQIREFVWWGVIPQSHPVMIMENYGYWVLISDAALANSHNSEGKFVDCEVNGLKFLVQRHQYLSIHHNLSDSEFVWWGVIPESFTVDSSVQNQNRWLFTGYLPKQELSGTGFVRNCIKIVWKSLNFLKVGKVIKMMIFGKDPIDISTDFWFWVLESPRKTIPIAHPISLQLRLNESSSFYFCVDGLRP